jgi:hypothetical protein
MFPNFSTGKRMGSGDVPQAPPQQPEVAGLPGNSGHDGGDPAAMVA